MTMSLIGTITLGAGGNTAIEFNSIPASYDDLYILLSYRTGLAATYQYINIYFNDSTTSVSARNLLGTGSAVSSNTTAQIDAGATSATATSNTFSNVSIYVPNYKGSTNKSYSADGVTENNAAAGFQSITAGLWANTAAITKISLTAAGQTIQQYSTASLYGILKGSGGATVA